jgi:hypothetical protein
LRRKVANTCCGSSFPILHLLTVHRRTDVAGGFFLSSMKIAVIEKRADHVRRDLPRAVLITDVRTRTLAVLPVQPSDDHGEDPQHQIYGLVRGGHGKSILDARGGVARNFVESRGALINPGRGQAGHESPAPGPQVTQITLGSLVK